MEHVDQILSEFSLNLTHSPIFLIGFSVKNLMLLRTKKEKIHKKRADF